MKWSRSDVIAVVIVALIGSLIAALFGTLAWLDWVALQEQRRVIADGVEVHAEIKGAREVKTRGDTRYLVITTWKDRQGASRTRNSVNVTKAFFQEVEAGRKSAPLKYLPAEPKLQPVFVEDAAALDSDRISENPRPLFCPARWVCGGSLCFLGGGAVEPPPRRP